MLYEVITNTLPLNSLKITEKKHTNADSGMLKAALWCVHPTMPNVMLKHKELTHVQTKPQGTLA